MFIGKKPTDAPLTSSDVADGIITNAKLAQDIISADTALGAEPADTDEFLVSDAGVLKRMDYSYIKGGITEADQWRLNSDLDGDQDPIASNLERVDTDGFSVLGTGMSQSSGIFTFPSTGYWDIRATFQFSSGATDNQKTGYIATTTDNSSYSDASHCVANFYASGTLASVNTNFIFDCTNTSTHKVRFRVATTGGSGNTLGSDTDRSMTFFTFIKLANT